MTQITVKRSNKFYRESLNNFSRQFSGIKQMTKVYVNDNNKVFAGEWIDNSGVVNFNGGYAIDSVKVVNFAD